MIPRIVFLFQTLQVWFFQKIFNWKKKGQCGKQQIPESNGTQEFNLGGQPKCSRVQVKWGNQAECSSYGSVLHLDGKEGGSELFSGPAEGEEHIPACHFTCPSLRRAPAGMVSHHLLRKIRKKKISSLGSDTVRRMWPFESSSSAGCPFPFAHDTLKRFILFFFQ